MADTLEFDGELPINEKDVREFLARALPVKRFGYCRNVTFVPPTTAHDGYVEIEFLGDSVEEIEVETVWPKTLTAGEAPSERPEYIIKTEMRRYRVPEDD